MNHAEWKKETEKTYDFLNKFDLINHIRLFRDSPVYDFMQYLDKELKRESDEEVQTYLFNTISIAEFAEYLRGKYNVDIHEVLTL